MGNNIAVYAIWGFFIVAGASITAVTLTNRVEKTKSVPIECVTDQVKLYGDLCAESSSGYETMKGDKAHFAGVKCAVDSILMCGGEK